MQIKLAKTAGFCFGVDRAVNLVYGLIDKGERVSSAVPYGYMKSSDDSKQWIIDDAVADNVRYIFRLCLEGLGPTKIARRLEQEKISFTYEQSESFT